MRRRGQNRLQNGIQIFSGGVPIYRGDTLVGAVGVSGDGIDQDDMVAFPGSVQRRRRGLASAKRRRRSVPTIVIQVAASGAAALRQLSLRAVPRHLDQDVCSGK